MIYDSHQGTRLSPGQRDRLDQQRHARSFINPVLQDSINETMKKLDERKQQGAKPERVWFLERQETGTVSLAEWMGY